MTTRLRGTIALLVVSTLGAACTAPGEPTAASTTTTTVTTTATDTAPPETVTPSPVTATETARPAAESGASSTAGAPSPALAALGTLPVKGRAPQTGYDRAHFGQAWSDAVEVDGGHNGCDSRIICTPRA
ncbi:hypothetical protein O9K63_02630 [Janibacter cremeus]|uniref:hypothetical protein n=1 Tax=Janibacter cremeus TaxID=1285192 RepID=UPI0023F6F111|nr:hypothetical protein [Janibacter cremeus]WEV78708.1 hypothetical protein O9K63_02630 [Janibacter cremeus]